MKSVDLWRNLFASLLNFVVRVRCRRKKSSRSLSHLQKLLVFYGQYDKLTVRGYVKKTSVFFVSTVVLHSAEIVDA